MAKWCENTPPNPARLIFGRFLAEVLTMLKMRWLAAFGCAIALMLVPSLPVRADEVTDQKAVDRAHAFLKDAARGRGILSFVHFGTKYAGHKYKESRVVNDGAGKRIAGQFALVYTFDWNDDGWSDVAFLCDRRGNVYRVQVVDHNATLNQPFALANVTIQVLGNLIIEAFKDKMTAEERKQIQKAVDDADAKHLLEIALKLQQALGT